MRRRLTNERGFSLILALGALVSLTITVTAVIGYTSTNTRSTNIVKAQQTAGALAEAGLNNAISVLEATDATKSTSLYGAKNVAAKQTYADGWAWWWGTLSGTTWTLHGLGEVVNPTGAAHLTHEVTANVSWTNVNKNTLNTVQWNYIMSTGTGQTCDQTIAGGGNTGNPATIASRLYVFGNLCIGTSDGGIALITDGPLIVKGKLYINNGSSGVGASGTPINEVHVGNGCQLLSNATHTPCGGADRVWATVSDTTIPTVAAPLPDFTSWYTNASPGPKNACAAVTGTPPTWDNNTTRDNSITTAFELTSASSYSCKIPATGTPTGQLTWDATSKTLTVAGTMFIDGSVKMTNGAINQYNGQATIYLSGTLYMSSGTKMCGSISGTNCDFATWNPNTELLAFVANGTGAPSPVPAGVSIYLYNAQLQGALYGTGKIRLEGTTRTDGPMVASEVELGYNVSTASAAANGFPNLTNYPPGLPTPPPNAHAQPTAPTGFKDVHN
jgi:hypothetical protein